VVSFDWLTEDCSSTVLVAPRLQRAVSVNIMLSPAPMLGSVLCSSLEEFVLAGSNLFPNSDLLASGGTSPVSAFQHMPICEEQSAGDVIPALETLQWLPGRCRSFSEDPSS